MSTEIDSDGQGKGDWAAPIARENLGDSAYEALREALMRGRLRPGERLQLRPTSARLGISATPMREAILRLASKDLLTLDGRGTAVVPHLTERELLEIRDIRLDLEGRAARMAAERIDAEGIDMLARLQEELEAGCAADDFPSAIQRNTEFHLALCRFAGMPILADIVGDLWVRCGPVLSHLYDGGGPDWDEHPHDTLIDALRAGDGAAAEEAIRYDITYGGKGLLDYVCKTDARGEAPCGAE